MHPSFHFLLLFDDEQIIMNGLITKSKGIKVLKVTRKEGKIFLKSLAEPLFKRPNSKISV